MMTMEFMKFENIYISLIRDMILLVINLTYYYYYTHYLLIIHATIYYYYDLQIY
jgi:hypothetical protein